MAAPIPRAGPPCRQSRISLRASSIPGRYAPHIIHGDRYHYRVGVPYRRGSSGALSDGDQDCWTPHAASGLLIIAQWAHVLETCCKHWAPSSQLPSSCLAPTCCMQPMMKGSSREASYLSLASSFISLGAG